MRKNRRITDAEEYPSWKWWAQNILALIIFIMGFLLMAVLFFTYLPN